MKPRRPKDPSKPTNEEIAAEIEVMIFEPFLAAHSRNEDPFGPMAGVAISAINPPSANEGNPAVGHALLDEINAARKHTLVDRRARIVAEHTRRATALAIREMIRTWLPNAVIGTKVAGGGADGAKGSAITNARSRAQHAIWINDCLREAERRAHLKVVWNPLQIATSVATKHRVEPRRVYRVALPILREADIPYKRKHPPRSTKE